MNGVKLVEGLEDAYNKFGMENVLVGLQIQQISQWIQPADPLQDFVQVVKS